MITKVLLLVFGCLILVLTKLHRDRFRSISTIRRLTDYDDDFNLYKIDIKYDYGLDEMLNMRFDDNASVAEAILKKALPHFPIQMKSPDFSCSTFGITDIEGDVLMGRNYDFDVDTSVLLVHCAPKDGYKSVGLVSLDHVNVKTMGGIVEKISALPSPYICLDGMNEKGVSIAVLMLDSESAYQESDRSNLFTTLAIRLVLDRAATTQEAVDLLRSYDMFAVSGGDYQYFITDAFCDCRVIEYDCHSKSREMVDIPVRVATNFYQLYIDKVLPNQRNGIYGHGKERYELIEEILTKQEGHYSKETAWEALKASQQLPKPGDRTSNTQWSVVYNNTKLSAGIVLRRNWGDITSYSLEDNVTSRAKNNNLSLQ